MLLPPIPSIVFFKLCLVVNSLKGLVKTGMAGSCLQSFRFNGSRVGGSGDVDRLGLSTSWRTTSLVERLTLYTQVSKNKLEGQKELNYARVQENWWTPSKVGGLDPPGGSAGIALKDEAAF